MKIKLLRAARIRHEAGETVDVSPAEAGYLLSTGSAVKVAEAYTEREAPECKAEKPETAAEKKTGKKEIRRTT